MSTLTSSLIVKLIDKATGPAKAISSSLLGIQKTSKGVGASLGGAIEKNNAALANSRGGLADAAIGFYALKKAITAPIRSAMQFESGLADLQKASDFDDAGLEKFGKRLRKIATSEIPMVLSDLTALATEAAKAGVPESELEDFTKMAAKTGVAWDMSGAEAGEALAKIRSALGLSNEETGLYADAINQLGDNLATSERNIVDYARQVVSMGEFFGYAKEETIAFGAAMVAAGAQPEVAATSFRNMGKALTKGASATKRQEIAFKTLGLNSRKVAKAMQKDAVGTTLKVIEKLGSLPEHIQASVMSDLFGDEARALAPLLKNTDLLRKALGLVSDETKYAGSVQDAFAKRAKTAEYALLLFQSRLNDVALVIGASLVPGLVRIGEALGPLVMKLSEYAEAHPKIIAYAVGATAAVIGFKVALAGLKFMGLLGRGGALALLSIGFNTVGRAAIGATRAATSAVALQRALAGMSGMKMTGLQAVTTGLRGIAFAVPGVSAIVGVLSAVGGALAAISAPVWGGIALGAALVAGAGALIYKYWDRISSFFSGVGRAIGEELAPAIEFAMPLFDALGAVGDVISSAFSGLGGIISSAWDGVKSVIASMFTQEVLGEEAKSAFENAGHALMKALLQGIKNGARAVLDYVGGLGSRLASGVSNAASSSLKSIKGWFGGGEEAPASDNQSLSGHRATGGPVHAGGSFLVGENEPEIFTPKSGGTITPASKAGASGPITIGPFNISGVIDPEEVARKVSEIMDRELRSLLRRAHADVW